VDACGGVWVDAFLHGDGRLKGGVEVCVKNGDFPVEGS
jgi:hypothetical protein